MDRLHYQAILNRTLIMVNLFIGVDGGGTKTEAMIQDEHGRTLGFGMAGPGNIRTSVSNSWHSVLDAIDQAARQSNLDLSKYDVHVGLGLAGTELSSAYSLFLETPHPFKTLILESDAHVACIGVHGGKDGAIIIIGTGVIGYQISRDHIYRTGGYGFPHSDEGGGAWLGMELFRLAFKAIDQRISWSPMLDELFKIDFKARKQAFCDYANVATPSDYACYAPLIFKHQDYDELAQNLLMRAADEINQIFSGLCAQSKSSTCPLGLLGGIAPFITPYLADDLKKKLIERKADAPLGAIMMLKQHMGLSL